MKLPTFDLNALAIKAFAVALLASLLVFGGCRWQAHNDAGTIEKAASRAAALQSAVNQLADLTAEAAKKAKAASTKVQAATTAADKRYEDARHEANRSAADLAAALRTGKQRLSDTWTCPAPAVQPGGAATDAGQAASARRNDSAARVVAAADADAAVIDWLWDRWKADRAAVMQAGCAVESP